MDDDERFASTLASVLAEEMSLAQLIIRSARTCADGQQVFDDNVDLVLVDNRLPDGSGTELIEAIHLSRPTVPIVAMSGFWDGPRRRGAVEAGASAVFDKSAPIEELLSILSQLIDGPSVPLD